jgi:hypothetical protein
MQKFMINKIILGLFVIVSAILIYFNIRQYNENKVKDTALIAAQDTIHHYITTYKSQGAYIKTIVADRNNAINLLKFNQAKNKDLIDSLTKNKRIQTIADIQVENHTQAVIKDTVLKNIKFAEAIHTDWLDEKISVDSGKLTRDLDYRDAYIFSTELKKNPGLFTGSTLTTYVSPKNPSTKVTGVTSVSTVINKPKPTIAPAIGIGLNSDIKGGNIRLGWNAGVVITLK